jgi:hypothetical protein
VAREAAASDRLVHGHDAARGLRRADERLDVERHERPGIDHRHLDPLAAERLGSLHRPADHEADRYDRRVAAVVQRGRLAERG